jgi:GT2 family glycosyltransferase
MAVHNSVVVVSHNARDRLRRMLAALKMDEAPGCEVIVVDNASFDESPQMVSRDFPQVHLVPLDRNRGFASAANKGLYEAQGDVAIVCHADIVADLHDLAELADKLREAAGRRAAAVLPRLVGANGAPQPFVAPLPNLARGVLGEFKPALARRAYVPSLDHVSDNEFANLACCALDVAALLKLGGFDSKFFRYFADADLCARLHEKSLRLLISRDVKVVHTGAAMGQPVDAILSRLMRQDLVRYVEKHRSPVDQGMMRAAAKVRKLVTRSDE